MSGHSKWATIKRKKAAIDAKRGQIFTKLVKEITVAARQGGGDPDANPRLRMAVLAAKDANMPSDNIDRAIKKGTGELPGQVYVEVTYEGYGAGGVAILVEGLTDNKNRTSPEVRNIFAKKNGNLGENGCVAWMFNKIGLIVIPQSAVAEDKLFDIIVEAGADDLKKEGDMFEICMEITQFEAVKEALQSHGISWEVAELTRKPSSTVQITEEGEARALLNLIEDLEDHDDVQHVYANFEMDDELLEKLEG